MAGGGIYNFQCTGSACVQGTFEKFVWDSDIPATVCPLCGQSVQRKRADQRAYGADFEVPYASRAWGVDPKQISEAKANFPHHEFAPDGRLLIRNVKEYDRVRKDLGM